MSSDLELEDRKNNLMAGNKACVFNAALARGLSPNYECCGLAAPLCTGINNSRAVGQQRSFLCALRPLLFSLVRACRESFQVNGRFSADFNGSRAEP